MDRRKTKEVRIGNIYIGGENPVRIQSMTNVSSDRYDLIIRQIKELEKAGCEIVRLAVPKTENAEIFKIAKKEGITVPLVADIHFDYKIALESIKSGADKIRINPGNIGEKWKVKEVAEACKSKGLPIRIGVNSGSLSKSVLTKYGGPTAEAIAASALEEIETLESCGFDDIVVSIKSSNIETMVRSTEIIARETELPIHLGVTEAGDGYSGLIKNAIGIGTLLLNGIGDTLRVSLTADPVEEVRAGREILNSLKLNKKGCIDIISCPTCGRTRVNLIETVAKFKSALDSVDTKGKNITVAIMGCVVNGPGEAREADYGVAGAEGEFLLFKKGIPVKRIPESDAVDCLVSMIENEI